MNTRPIPIIMSLSAAGVSCLISISQGVEFSVFLARLIMAVILFYFVGIVVGIFLLYAFGPPRADTDDDIFDSEREDEEAAEEEQADGEEGEDDGTTVADGTDGEEAASEDALSVSSETAADAISGWLDEEPDADDAPTTFADDTAENIESDEVAAGEEDGFTPGLDAASAESEGETDAQDVPE